MKTTRQYLIVLISMLGAIFRLHAQGYIVQNGVVYLGDGGFGYEIDVLQNPTNSDYTGFTLTPEGQLTFSFDVIVDEGVRVFLVSPNQAISLNPILSQSYPELLPQNSYAFNSGVPFYVGLYTGYNPFDGNGSYTGIYSDPLFGWARLVNNQGVIQLIDSALVYQAGGIYAGTQNIISVPEPNTITLTGLGALLIGVFSIRKSFRA